MKEPAAQSILPAVPNELRPHARKQMNLKTRDFFSGLLEHNSSLSLHEWNLRLA